MTQAHASQPVEPLTEREREILGLMAAGQTNAEIAGKLFLTEGTVKWYNTQIFGKLGVKNRVEAIQAFATPPPASAQPRATFAQPDAMAHVVGRTRELDDVLSQLSLPETRLVTLLGPGGIGKTTLASMVAARVRGRYADGVYEIPLVAMTDGYQLFAAVADGIGIKTINERPLPPQLFAHLAGRRVLLVLDNVEQIADGAERIKELLTAAPRCRCLPHPASG